jgi:hypothetical protein
MVAVVAANSATKKLTCNKRRKVLMSHSPRNTASHCCVPPATYADANCSEAQVTVTSASMIMNPNLANELREDY